MNNILIKKGGRLVDMGEGAIYRKSELVLSEDDGVRVDANITHANGIQDAQKQARKLTQQSGVDSASVQAGAANQQADRGGEGVTLEVPVDSAATAAAADKFVKDPNMKDAEVKFVKESRIAGLKRNSIPFSKSELRQFLKTV